MEPYPWGDDVEWLAVDRDGRVAVFTTGGFGGPIPRAFLEEPGVLERMNDAIWSLLEVSDSVLLVALPTPNDFDAFARRGLYAFDWADTHRTTGLSNRYEIVARPTTPARLTDLDLPAELQQLIATVTAPALDFTQPNVDVQDLDCVDPSS